MTCEASLCDQPLTTWGVASGHDGYAVSGGRRRIDVWQANAREALAHTFLLVGRRSLDGRCGQSDAMTA